MIASDCRARPDVERYASIFTTTDVMIKKMLSPAIIILIGAIVAALGAERLRHPDHC